MPASIQITVQFVNNSQKPITPVLLSLPPSANQSNQSRNKSSYHCSYSFEAHLILIVLVVIHPVREVENA